MFGDGSESLLEQRGNSERKTSPLCGNIADASLTRRRQLNEESLESSFSNRGIQSQPTSFPGVGMHGCCLPIAPAPAGCPPGGTTAFPWLLSGDDAKPFCQAAAERGILLVPGDCYNMPSHFRLGFANVAPEAFSKALDRLGELTKSWSARMTPA